MRVTKIILIIILMVVLFISCSEIEAEQNDNVQAVITLYSGGEVAMMYKTKNVYVNSNSNVLRFVDYDTGNYMNISGTYTVDYMEE